MHGSTGGQTAGGAATRWLAVALLAVGMAGCERSVDPTLKALAVPAGEGSRVPHLDHGGDGTLVLSWLEPADEAMELRVAERRGGEWSPARTVVRGSDWFVNWADFPSVSPIAGELWAAHWLVKRPGGRYAYDVAVALSSDGGRTWGEAVVPHDDGTLTEHGFVSLFPWRDRVGVLWLDGRNTGGDHDGGHSGGMTLRSGALGADGAAYDGALVDELVCDCCQTDVAVATAGPIAVYRNRTADEVRDIYASRLVDGRWLPGTPVADDGWVIKGCPVNGPAVAARGDRVAVAWFTAANDRARVRAALSADGGASFADAVDIDSEKPVGRVDVDWLSDDAVAVSWIASGDDGQGDIAVRTVGRNGSLGPVHRLATVAKTRASGFPQMVRDGDRLVFVWTDAGGHNSTLRGGTLPLDALR